MSLALFEARVIELLEQRAQALEQNFPETAAAILHQCLPPQGFAPADLVRELIARPELARQRDSRAKFGEPPVTLLEVGDAYCDVYFWHKSATSVHSHTFEGAFAVAHGSSIHSTYSFQTQQTCGTAQLGRVLHQKTELLSVGDVRLILPGEQLNHRVSHLGAPSVSLVIRRGDFGPASHFVSPTLKLPYLRLLPQHVERKFLLVEMAQQTNQVSLSDSLNLARKTWQPEDIIHCLRLHFTTLAPQDFSILLRESQLLDEPWSEALQEAHAWQHACGGSVSSSSEPERRLVWSLGSSLGNRSSTRSILQQYFQCEDVGAKTVDVLLGLIEAKVLPLELNDSAQVLLEVLIDDGNVESWIEELVEAQGEENRSAIATDVQLAASQMREHPFLSSFIV